VRTAGSLCIGNSAMAASLPDGSRVRRESHARFCERLEVKSLRPTHPPLDIHLWTDTPLPELGPVEPVLWDEVAVGLDEQMLATGGIWLGNAPHAAKAYPELFSENTLKQARKRAQTQAGSPPTSEGTFPIIDTIGNVPSLLSPIRYQLAGERQKPARALTLLGLSETRAWLEERLGPLVKFEVIEPEAPAAKAAE